MTTPRPYHHGDLRRALLSAARTALEAEGPAALSLRAVARAAGVAAPSVYNHFDGRAGLLAALAGGGFATLGAALGAARDGTGQDLLETGLAYLRFARANPALYRLMFGEGLRPAKDQDPLRTARSAVFAALEGQVGSREAALHHWALVHGLALLALDGQVALGPEPDAALAAILRAD